MSDIALFKPLDILATMRAIPGWLEDGEAELLMAAAAHVTRGGTARTLVEIGSYQGRSTIVIGATLLALSPQSRLHAIDPHEGIVGSSDARLNHGSPTFDAFLAHIADAGIAQLVEPVRALSYETAWTQPIDMLFIDGLHDRVNVERDFRHFAPFLTSDAVVLFHDYASYYPGVMAFVDHLVGHDGWRIVAAAGSMRMLRHATNDEYDR
jgi:predicted O-methyltransferase YrrM